MPWFSQTEVSGSLSHVLALKILATLYSYSFLAGLISSCDLMQTPERSPDMLHSHQQQRSEIRSLMLK